MHSTYENVFVLLNVQILTISMIYPVSKQTLFSYLGERRKNINKISFTWQKLLCIQITQTLLCINNTATMKGGDMQI